MKTSSRYPGFEDLINKTSMILLGLFLFFNVLQTNATEVDAQDSIAKKPGKNLALSGIVLPAKTPENGWYAQGGVIGVFKTEMKDSNLRASNLYLFGLYSQYQQMRFSIGGDVFFAREKYFLNFWHYYTKFPDMYFGTGPATSQHVSEFVNFRAISLNTTLLRQVERHLYIGAVHAFEHLYDINFPTGGLMDTYQPAGNRSYVINGIGPRFRKDSRNNILSTLRGTYLDYNCMYYHPVGKDGFEFFIQNFDGRYFIDLSRKKVKVIALQVMISDAYGEIPFRFLPSIATKGYHPNLFRIHKMAAVQAEFRFYYYKGLGATLFGGLAYGSEQWFDSNVLIKPNAGAGLRFRIVPRYNLNLRVDAGVGANGLNTYLSFTESF